MTNEATQAQIDKLLGDFEKRCEVNMRTEAFSLLVQQIRQKKPDAPLGYLLDCEKILDLTSDIDDIRRFLIFKDLYDSYKSVLHGVIKDGEQ